MRHLRTLAAGVTIAILIAACGSNSGASNGPSNGASNGPGGGSSTEPSAEASTGGGGGGGANFDDGKAHFEITGAATKSGDLGYYKGFGMIDATGNQVALTFVNLDSSASLTINSGPTGSVVLYADEEIGATILPVGTVVGECTVNFSTLEANHAKGTFRCEHIAIVESGGQSIAGEGTLSGDFEARE